MITEAAEGRTKGNLWTSGEAIGQLGITSATLIGAALATAHGNSRPRNLPTPTLFSMTSQTMAEARDHSASVGSSVVAIVASESPEFRTVI
jgi:hypothetical protein